MQWVDNNMLHPFAITWHSFFLKKKKKKKPLLLRHVGAPITSSHNVWKGDAVLRPGKTDAVS